MIASPLTAAAADYYTPPVEAPRPLGAWRRLDGRGGHVLALSCQNQQ